LFVCENNQFATEVPFRYAAGNPGVAQRGAIYGLPGIEVDGNDVLAVHEVAGEAIRRARAGLGATLIECKTYRTRAHAEASGDFGYGTKAEVEEWKTRCPIANLRTRLTCAGEKNGQPELETQLNAITAEVAEVIAQAHQFAESSPWPDPATATSHVYDERGSAGARSALRAPALPRSTPREITFMKATHEALAHEMAKNPAIFVLGEGIGKRGGNFKTTE